MNVKNIFAASKLLLAIVSGLGRAVFSSLSKGAEEFARYLFVNVNKGYNISL